MSQASPSVTPAAPDFAEYDVRCLEVWGGNQAVRRKVVVPGIDAWLFSQPYAGQSQGGDIHYVSSCFTGRVARFAVADVSGHGEAVGRLATTLRSLMRKHINYLDQTELARVLNKEFGDLAQDGKFATAVLLSYYAPTDDLIVCNAGHPRPFWFRARTGQWQALVHDSPDRAAKAVNLPLGVIEPTSFHQFAVRLEPQDLVLVYTDALVEAQAPGGRQLGEEGLLALLRGCDARHPAALTAALLEAVARHRAGTAADDDQTVLVLHHNASEFQKKPLREAVRKVAFMLGIKGD